MSVRALLTLTTALTGVVVGASPAIADPVGTTASAAPLATAFDTAAARYDVPRDLLVALGYAESRLDMHGGAPSAAGGLERVVVPGGVGALSTDYGPAAWAPASTSNYTVASRPGSHQVNRIVIHTAQGSYSGTVGWFQNPAAQASAHYTFRSSDGAVTQSVREKDIAWHAGNWTYNTQSIGIEHEGFVDNAAWLTDAMYRASAALTRSLATKYGIPKDRAHIIGHNEVPGATHTDPGPNWNWTYYLQLVNGITGVGSGTVSTSASTLNVRSGPGANYPVVGSVAGGAAVAVYCQAVGSTVTGPYGTTAVWNRIGTNRYVSDAYVLTGYDGYIPNVPRC
ncbi:N-acetylmuramoyl-L-alanine amidase [Micromonospora sp. NPDC002411]